MAETGAIFGGEHSGHYYFRDNYRADSGIIAAMVVLELLSVTRQAPLRAAGAVPAVLADSGEINTVVDDPAGAVELLAAEVEAAGGELGEPGTVSTA
jgi:phosphomannomutase